MPAPARGGRVGGVRARRDRVAITGRWWPTASRSWPAAASYFFAKHFGDRRSRRAFAAAHQTLAYLRL